MQKKGKSRFKFVYTGLRVSNLPRSVNFYTKILGMKVYRRGTMPHGGKFVGLKSPRSDVELELNWYPKRSSFYTPFRNSETMDHLAFSVGKGNSVSAYKRLLKSKVRPAVTLEEAEGICDPYAMDPDGNWIEILEWD